MWKLISSTSNAFSCSLKSLYLHILYINIFLLFVLGLYGNIFSWSTTVILNIDDFGAKGDRFTDDTKSLQDAWNAACSSSSQAEILIPAGKYYLVGPIKFAGPCVSKVSGVIIAPKDPSVWDGFHTHNWLYFRRVKHLKVEGGGIIDGMGKEWWARSCKTNASNPCTHAPNALTFHECRDLKVKNITLVNSPHMHMTFRKCRGVAVSEVRVKAPAASPNTDGIHISASTHLKLRDIIVGTGDDCISIVKKSSRIRIRNIFCGPGHGISIGSLGKYNSSALVQDVIVNGAILLNTTNGARIKTWQGGSGFARKIKFENIWMKNVSNPIIIDQYYCDSRAPCSNQTSAVIIDDISFRGINGTSATEEAIKLACSDSYPCKRMHLENIQLTTSTGTAKSLCWEAYGSSSGLVYPPSCISSGAIIHRHQV